MKNWYLSSGQILLPCSVVHGEQCELSVVEHREHRGGGGGVGRGCHGSSRCVLWARGTCRKAPNRVPRAGFGGAQLGPAGKCWNWVLSSASGDFLRLGDRDSAGSAATLPAALEHRMAWGAPRAHAYPCTSSVPQAAHRHGPVQMCRPTPAVYTQPQMFTATPADVHIHLLGVHTPLPTCTPPDVPLHSPVQM